MKSTRLKLTISSILGGMQPFQQMNGDQQFLVSLGVDPELVLGSQVKPCGIIAPSRYGRFSSEYLTGAPMFITGSPTTSGVFAYDSGGTMVSYSSTLTGEVGIGNPGGAGNGMVEYNDYVYCATGTDVYRYGRLSLTAPLFGQYWTTTLAMSALTNYSYPQTRNVIYPNHVMLKHTDGFVYLLDYDGANGRVHRFITSSDGTAGTAEWDVLQLPPKMMPMGMASYGEDLAIICSPEATYVAGAIPRTGEGVMYLWSTVSTERFYRAVGTGEQLATGIVNKKGALFVTAGNIDRGMKLLRYMGGYEFQAVSSVSDGSPPPAGAIDVLGDTVAWGQSMTYPAAMAGIYGFGYRTMAFTPALHGLARISDTTGTLPIVTSLKFLEIDSRPVIGWRTSVPAAYGLDKTSAAGTYASVWLSQQFKIGRKFAIRRIVFPLSDTLAAGMSITPTIYVDNDEVNYTTGASGLKDITSANYGSVRLADMKGLTVEGEQDFSLMLSFGGTTQIGVGFPIEIEVDVYD